MHALLPIRTDREFDVLALVLHDWCFNFSELCAAPSLVCNC